MTRFSRCGNQAASFFSAHTSKPSARAVAPLVRASPANGPSVDFTEADSSCALAVSACRTDARLKPPIGDAGGAHLRRRSPAQRR
jgi:hypothetical protein